MPNLVEWNNCCGCGACANKCPKGAISMKPNKEGFLHPEIDKNLCVECGACEKACPGLEPAKATGNKPQAFIVQHKSDTIRFQSTSGGAFTAIAEAIINRGGVVFGAAMTDELTVKHISVNTVEGLAKFRNSKYVQSEIGNCYKEAKERLVSGQWVCFSGTPCQINGLYKYLGKDYENLIAVDVVCKSVPSPLVFEKYIEYKKGVEGNVSDVVFRDKKRGFLYCTMAHYASHEDRQLSKEIYRRGSESDEWLRLFLGGKISRRSCMNCSYQTKERVGDFTLGDIWETGHTELDDNKGSTLVHIWTEKGKAFFEYIKPNIRCVEYSIEKSRGTERTNTLKVQPNREKLFEDANNVAPDAFMAKYAPYTMKIRLKNTSRYLLWKLGLQNLVRHVKHLIIHRRQEMNHIYRLFIWVMFIVSFCSCGQGKTIAWPNGISLAEDTINSKTLGLIKDGVISIDKDIDLRGHKCVVPPDVTLTFNGGVVKNGTLVGNNTRLNGKIPYFDRVRITGLWDVPTINTTLFKDLSYDNSIKDVVALSNQTIKNEIVIGKGEYFVSAIKNNDVCIPISSNTKLTIDGEIRIKPNNLCGYNIIQVTGDNVVIRGNGVIVGDKFEHYGNEGEWGMGIRITKAHNIHLEGLTIKECWGDCIYIGKNSRNIVVNNCILDNGRRQGVSITSGEKIVIKNCAISNVGGTKPQYAIDVEPNKNEFVSDVLIEKCRINRCCGGITSSGGAKGAHIGSIRINKCSISDITSHAPLKLRTADYVTIENCDINNKTIRLVFLFQGVNKVVIRNNVIKTQRFLLEPCSNLSLLNNDISCRNFYTKEDKESKFRNILIMNNTFKGTIPELGQSNKGLNIVVSKNKLKK